MCHPLTLWNNPRTGILVFLPSCFFITLAGQTTAHVRFGFAFWKESQPFLWQFSLLLKQTSLLTFWSSSVGCPLAKQHFPSRYAGTSLERCRTLSTEMGISLLEFWLAAEFLEPFVQAGTWKLALNFNFWWKSVSFIDIPLLLLDWRLDSLVSFFNI